MIKNMLSAKIWDNVFDAICVEEDGVRNYYNIANNTETN